MTSFIGNNVRPDGAGLIPPRKVISGGYRSIIGNGSGLFSVPFTTEWNVAGDATARTITLPLVNTRAEGALSYNCVVDWGDGTPSSLVTAYNDVNRIHTYASNGTYQVKITGTMEGWSFNSGGDCLKIRKIINWGGKPSFNGFKYLAGGFYGCTNLTKAGTGPIPASGTGILSDGFVNTFSGTAITNIPSGLFYYHTAVTTFSSVFLGCTSLTSVPARLFSNNTIATNFSGVFSGCTSLTTIPSDIFEGAVAATDLSTVLNNCPLSSIPAGLFDTNIAVTTFYSAFRKCLSVSIPVGLFDNNTLVTDFGRVFLENTNLTSIPSGLFDNNTRATSFGLTFQSCTALTTIPAGLFDNNTLVTNFSSAFLGCTALTTIPAGLFDNNTAVTTFASAFQGCTVLATTPSELFRFNTLVTTFASTFNGCIKMQQKIDLFYAAGEEGTRFLNKSVNFSNCFNRASFTGTQGTAPDLWNCSFGTGTPTKTDCWNGAGNSLTSLNNYASIPGDWI